MEQVLALVAVENVAYHFDILYGYILPEELLDKAQKGMRVLVPFGRGKTSKRQGVIFDFSVPEDSIRYKEIITLLDEETVVSGEMLSIAEFLKDRTFCTYFEAIKVQIPSGFNFRTTLKYFAVQKDNGHQFTETEKEVYSLMMTFNEPCDKKQIYSKLGLSDDCDALDKLVCKGFVVKTYDAVKKIGEATNKCVTLIADEETLSDPSLKLTSKQQSVISTLKDVGTCTVKELCYFTGVTVAVVNTLERKHLVEISDKIYYRIPETSIVDKAAADTITLTNQQRNAYDSIIKKYKNGGGVSLLYGITGSGKTSVFLSVIDEVIKDDKQVIVMVPEISLTPQMMSIFKGRYGSEVAIFHSALSVGERRDEYKRVKDGLVRIVVGTRSAVFAPFENIGLIVIDEEQEHTYKSESSPRYNTIDVAKFRATKHNALVLLSSATPSVESYSYAKNGKYDLLILTERYGNAVLPDVSLVDMKQDRKSGNKYNISSKLLELLEKNLENNKQSILLINRRGYNTFVACDSCGSVVNCPSCSISMTYHTANNRLMCHYCGYSTPFTKTCRECGKDDVRYAGYGTQRIEKEIETLLPEAKVLRMDTDSTSSRHSFEKYLIDFGEKKYDIMLGTQMVAKGLNFENVTLVGVINADQQLNNDDFRSEERTFDLLTQVVGRSGRGKNKGNAVIQTLTPENHIIQLAQKQDYDSFYNSEITIRKALIYPPFCDICTVYFTSEKEVDALNCSRAFLSSLTNKVENEFKSEKIIVLGPMPPRISKVNNKFRYRIIIKCKNSKNFRKMLSELLIRYGKETKFNNITITADINPVNLI